MREKKKPYNVGKNKTKRDNKIKSLKNRLQVIISAGRATQKIKKLFERKISEV